jgi:hypothetical protein
MKAVLAIALLGLQAIRLHAGNVPPDLQALEARSSQSLTTGDEQAREYYIMDLARLRFRFISEGDEGWRDVDREIIRHPFRGDLDPIDFLKLRVGQWYSSRHDYLYKADGTWKMDDPGGALPHGTWSLERGQYSETFADDQGVSATTYTLILADPENFIFTDGTHLFFEVRNLDAGLPVR